MSMIKLPDQFGVERWLKPEPVDFMTLTPRGDGQWSLVFEIRGDTRREQGTEEEMRALAEQIAGASPRSIHDQVSEEFHDWEGPFCRVCHCTDSDCSQCIERTGKPCSWVEGDLCSACDQAIHGIHAVPAYLRILQHTASLEPWQVRAVAEALLREADQMPRMTFEEHLEVSSKGLLEKRVASAEEATQRHLEAQAKIERESSPSYRESSAAVIAAERHAGGATPGTHEMQGTGIADHPLGREPGA